MRPRDQSQIARQFVDDDLLIRLRLTHLCLDNQRSQCFTVVISAPDDPVLTWF